MHEMGIALQIMEIAAAAIPDAMKPVKVARVNLKIGKLAAVVPDSLRFCFEAASRDTDFAGAELAIEEVPVAARCKGCGERWEITEPVFTCRVCEGGELEILSGRELDIVSIEVAEEGAPDAGQPG
jgi:hydrogenase nickel incorporation protein HypA/HybF